jgi:hypothetical protein
VYRPTERVFGRGDPRHARWKREQQLSLQPQRSRISFLHLNMRLSNSQQNHQNQYMQWNRELLSAEGACSINVNLRESSGTVFSLRKPRISTLAQGSRNTKTGREHSSGIFVTSSLSLSSPTVFRDVNLCESSHTGLR